MEHFVDDSGASAAMTRSTVTGIRLYGLFAYMLLLCMLPAAHLYPAMHSHNAIRDLGLRFRSRCLPSCISVSRFTSSDRLGLSSGFTAVGLAVL